MQERAYTKSAALVVGVMVLSFTLLQSIGVLTGMAAGISEDASWLSRLLHPFFHAGWLHALLNVYVLWQVTFFCRIHLSDLLAGYVLACCCPSSVALWSVVGAQPENMVVIGLSGVVHALLGCAMAQSAAWHRFTFQVLFCQLPGLWLGGMSVGLHLWCFFGGAMWWQTRRFAVG